MKDGQLAVFFRNNHFSTMVKEGGSLYLLVTDLGFLDNADVVWETLDSVQGDTVFVDKQFKVVDSQGRKKMNIYLSTTLLLSLNYWQARPNSESIKVKSIGRISELGCLTLQPPLSKWFSKGALMLCFMNVVLIFKWEDWEVLYPNLINSELFHLYSIVHRNYERRNF